MDVTAGTIVVWSDIGCPWAHLAVYRLRETRRRLGLDGAVTLDHRAFPLEVVNERPTPKRTLDAEIPVAGALEPGAGWQMWQERPEWYPVTTLPALEAVQAAKEQGPAASEALDAALRRAMFGESRCISMVHVILGVAREAGIDDRELGEALADGRSRRHLSEQARRARSDEIAGSPHLFLPGGTDVHNPGIDMRWEGEPGTGFPVVLADDAGVYEGILRAATR